MTEAEWLACMEPEPLLVFLSNSGKATDRKLRLFACACCRRIWRKLRDPRARQAVEVSERYADGLATKKELTRARLAARAAAWNARAARARQVSWDAPGRVAWFAACEAIGSSAKQAARTAVWVAAIRELPGGDGALPGPQVVGDLIGERGRFAALLRDLFGPLPFRPVTVSPEALAWRDGTVVKLAASAYEERALPAGTLDHARLGILADGLEEAGCADGDLMGHLRGPGPHVRACWALDAILNKG
jgi:hypothetical protein